jgi:NAD-dependent protein deacetylases, SIR2 family
MNIFEKYQISAKSTIFFLTGAGLDAESGIKTFRDSENGLWADHSIEEVCTPEAFYRNPKKVHNFYNLRRQELKNAIPNVAHKAMVKLEKNVIYI